MTFIKGKVIIPDSMVLKLEYELECWQSEDIADYVVEQIIDDESPNEFTRGYLKAKFEGLQGEDKELVQNFLELVRKIWVVDKNES